MFESLLELDTDLLLAINGRHCDFFDYFMYQFSGKLVWIPLYVALWYVMLRNLTLKQLLWCSLGVVLVILFADSVCSHIIRPLVERWRPSREESPIDHLVHLVNGKRGGRYGFPSCHAANTVALTTYIFFLFRRRWLTLSLLVWALITCYSRAYLGVHYPGDLLAGALVGMSGAALVYLLLVKLAGYRTPHRAAYTSVPIAVGSLTVLGILVYATVMVV